MKGLVQFLGDGLDPDGSLERRLTGMGLDVGAFDPARGLAEQMRDADVVLLRDGPLGKAEFAGARNLKLVQRVGLHVYGVDLDVAAEHGVAVCYVPAKYNPGQSVAEHTLFLLLAVAKRARACERVLREQRLSQPVTTLLAGKTLGVLGLGRIGGEMVPLGRALGMEVIGIRETVYPGLAAALHLSWLGTLDDIGELVARSDVISLHLPLTERSRGIIGAAEISRMKPGTLLVNTARAALLDYEAVLEGIRSQQLGGLGMDVWWGEPAPPSDPLLAFENVVVTPHNAGSAAGARLGVVEVVAENIRRALAGEPVQFAVTGQRPARKSTEGGDGG